ncbi:MAG: amidohydrolase family protein [Alphaproteobacteria bacterium]|jgi:predicted TIM-barrel fold metal-dependent hydrolase|nr:amidohydrolase family protein [Alphaproteobacteria bacterium]
MSDIPIIDAHHHFWDLGLGKHPWLDGRHIIDGFRYGDYAAIRRDYLLEDYRRDSAGHNVVKTIHMETEWDPTDPVGETEWLQRYHDKTGFPHAVVGQAWFDRADIAEVLAGHAAYPLIRSVRQKPKAAASPAAFTPGIPGSMADPVFRDGYRHLATHGMHYDLQTPWWHLDEAADLARDFPDTTIILNHTGLPSDRSEAGTTGWREAIERFADQPNTAVKISGIGLAGEAWTAESNGALVLETIRIFGVDRCMFASNFPVDSLCASYDTIFTGFKRIVAGFSARDQRKLFHDNAVKYYRPA